MWGTGYGVSVRSLVYRMIWEAIAGQLAHDGHDRGMVYEMVDVDEITELLEKRQFPWSAEKNKNKKNNAQKGGTAAADHVEIKMCANCSARKDEKKFKQCPCHLVY